MNVTQLLELHKETTDAARATMEKKNSDYCGGEQSTDALANFKAASQFNLHPATGLLLRVQDKLMRVQSFVADGQLRVDNESVEDACDDIVNYAILLKAIFTEEKQKPKSKVKLKWVSDRKPTLEDATDGIVLVWSEANERISFLHCSYVMEGEKWAPVPELQFES